MRFKGIIYVLVFVLGTNIAAFSNSSSKVDSLNNLLEKTHDIESKIYYLTLLSYEYQTIDLDSASLLIDQALTLSNEIASETHLGEIFACMGDIAVMRDSLEKAIEHYNRSLEYLASEDKLYDKALVLMVLGNIYLITDNIRSSMQHYQDGLNISEENNFKNIIGSISNNLGIIYFESGEYEKALEYYDRSYKISEERNNVEGMAETLENIGSVYYNLDQYDLARDYFLKANKLFETAGNSIGIVHCLIRLANLEMEKTNYYQAIVYLDSCMMLLELSDQSYKGPRSTIFADVFLAKGISNLGLGNTEYARKFLMDAYDIALTNHQLKMLVSAAENLTEVYTILDQPDSAIKYFGLYKLYAEDLNNERNVRTTELLGMQYEYDKRLREQELEMSLQESIQKRRNLIYIIITGGLLLILVIFALLLRLEKSKKGRIELERKNLENELEYRNKELTTYVMYLMKKNEFIMSISEKIKKAKLKEKSDRSKIFDEIISELETNSETISWGEFELRFQKVHSDYYKTLNDKFPDLTPNELRLCAFLRLNMTTKEIASITYQSLKSIDIARYRLRKKLGMEKDENLVTFLQKL